MIKEILLEEKPKTKKIKEKEKTKRKIIETNSWTSSFSKEDYEMENQLQMLNSFANENEIPNKIKILKQEIQKKIQGYKHQDILKNKYDDSKFICFSKLIDLMKETNMICYYCKEHSYLIYDNVREPKQWSLERKDNQFGHNEDNVTIACLHCNLRRKTMIQEKYVITKQLKNIIKINSQKEEQNE